MRQQNANTNTATFGQACHHCFLKKPALAIASTAHNNMAPNAISPISMCAEESTTSYSNRPAVVRRAWSHCSTTHRGRADYPLQVGAFITHLMLSIFRMTSLIILGCTSLGSATGTSSQAALQVERVWYRLLQ